MSESYPYFSISRQFGIPYGEVLDLASSYERMLIWNISKLQSVSGAAIYSAVIAEKARREKVSLINNLSTTETS